MLDFEQFIETAVANEDIPGCVLLASSRDGSFTYTKTFGKRSMHPDRNQLPLRLDSVMWIASCTKLMTSICALQLVERGHLTLDEPVCTHIPELKDRAVITGFQDDGTPIEEPHKTPITLRLLLTHCSGIAYDVMHPNLIQWNAYHKRTTSPSGKILERYDHPLGFEPGTSWMYGPGIDFAGLLIERVTKLSLEDYMRANIWEPLGIKDMTFHLSQRPDLAQRMADMSKRASDGGKAVFTDERQSYHNEKMEESEDCFGGHGIMTSPEEYFKVLRAVLTTEEDERILKRGTVKMMFEPQMGEGGKAMLGIVCKSGEIVNNAMGGVPMELERDYGLGSMLLCGDEPGARTKGTLIWGGLPNLYWFVDPTTGLAGLYAGQVVPYGDAKSAAVCRKFEAGVYELYEKSKRTNSNL
ncbi:beta-lactamase/transpeptidase-like protein [Lophiostoma macrostomum CBS 122681]|uniref:Beta-lactamase/transpeptidase-like protein n=1 Tax=Lophiostoma macrostomum CBS 122681 TaxID=1314788 RepID=A0A6A6SXL2_9PLEO|nr:beta-lactamase/transpeptidase-like protein [Lophiostoma macrostomum CBS 122681]